jgi:hypothetical protein
MSQTRYESFVEACVNITLGYCIAVTSQMIIFPLFDIHIAASEHLAIGLFFTMVSLVRSYCIRRLFNSMQRKG